MPTSTLDKKISVNSFFQNSDEISDELNRVNEKSEQALQKSDSAIARAFSNENYLQSLIQSISTQNESIANVVSENKSQSSIINNTNTEIKKINQQLTTEIISIKRDDDSQVREITKAFGILSGLYDSLASAMLSVRSDVETISKYLFDEQKQRKQQLEQRELKISRQKDVQEKQSIVDSFRKSMGIGVKSDEGISKDSQMKSGDEANFMQSLMQGALASAGMSLGTALTNGTDGGTDVTAGDPNITSSSGVSGGTVDKNTVYSYIKSKGLSHNHAMGILAGIDGESSFQIGVQEKGHSKQGVGLFQYTYPSRKKAFLQAVPDYKTNWKGQVDYAIQQDPLTKAYLSKQFDTPEAAAEWWLVQWERPLESLRDERRTKYKKFISSFKPPQAQTQAQAQTKPPGAAQTSQASKSAAEPPAAAQTSQTSAAAPAASAAQTSQAMPADTQSDVTGGLKSKDGNLLKGATSKDMQEKIKQSSAQPLSSPTSASSIMPFDYQSARQSSETIPQPTQTSSNLSTAPDLPPEIPTNNPLTRMWTMSAINHLNINASMHHIYG
jgi:hypothetical protein